MPPTCQRWSRTIAPPPTTEKASSRSPPDHAAVPDEPSNTATSPRRTPRRRSDRDPPTDPAAPSDLSDQATGRPVSSDAHHRNPLSRQPDPASEQLLPTATAVSTASRPPSTICFRHAMAPLEPEVALLHATNPPFDGARVRPRAFRCGVVPGALQRSHAQGRGGTTFVASSSVQRTTTAGIHGRRVWALRICWRTSPNPDADSPAPVVARTLEP